MRVLAPEDSIQNGMLRCPFGVVVAPMPKYTGRETAALQQFSQLQELYSGCHARRLLDQWQKCAHARAGSLLCSGDVTKAVPARRLRTTAMYQRAGPDGGALSDSVAPSALT